MSYGEWRRLSVTGQWTWMAIVGKEMMRSEVGLKMLSGFRVGRTKRREILWQKRNNVNQCEIVINTGFRLMKSWEDGLKGTQICVFPKAVMTRSEIQQFQSTLLCFREKVISLYNSELWPDISPTESLVPSPRLVWKYGDRLHFG